MPAPVPIQTSEEPAAVSMADRAFDLLRDVPISITVLDQEEIQEEGIHSLRDLSGASPNFTAFDGGGNRMTQLSVRGVREQSYQSAPEVLPSVGYYFDDVPALTTLSRVTVFNNVGSLAVRKGPQNSDYGFSRAGGVVDIRSPEPSRTATGYAEGFYGNYDAYEFSAGISTPLVKDKLYFTGDFVTTAREGFYDNIATSGSYGDKDAVGGRFKLTATPTDRTTIDLMVQSERFRDQADPYIMDPLHNRNPFVVDFDYPGFEDIDQNMQALRIRSRFDSFDFLSVTAHRDSSWSYAADAIQYGAPYADFIGVTDEKVESYTQEFRFSSNTAPSQIGWKGGLFLARTDMDYEGGFLFGDGTPAGPPNIATTRADDVAVFGEVSLPVTTELTVVAGLRYEWAGRKGTNEFAPPSIDRGSENYSELLPSVALVYSANPDLSYFAKYSRSFRPGGFNARTSAVDPFDFKYDSETSDNFEIGVKSLHLDGRLGLNGSLFYTKFHDYQDLTQLTPTAFGLSNAQSARSYGAELETFYQVTKAVKLFAGLGYTNAEYDTFINSVGNFSGNKISFVPKYSATYGIEYQAESGLYFLARARTVGSYYLDDANTAEQGSYTLLGLTAGYRWEKFDVSVFANNLTDERYVVNATGFAGPGADMGTVGDPRIYGVRGRMTF